MTPPTAAVARAYEIRGELVDIHLERLGDTELVFAWANFDGIRFESAPNKRRELAVSTVIDEMTRYLGSLMPEQTATWKPDLGSVRDAFDSVFGGGNHHGDRNR